MDEHRPFPILMIFLILFVVAFVVIFVVHSYDSVKNSIRNRKAKTEAYIEIIPGHEYVVNTDGLIDPVVRIEIPLEGNDNYFVMPKSYNGEKWDTIYLEESENMKFAVNLPADRPFKVDSYLAKVSQVSISAVILDTRPVEDTQKRLKFK